MRSDDGPPPRYHRFLPGDGSNPAEPRPGEQGKVIVGVSLSLAGLEALRFAVTEARRREAPLIAVRAWDGQSTWAWSSGDYEPSFWQYEGTLPDPSRQIIAEAFEEAAPAMPAGLTVVRRTGEGVPGVVLRESVTSPRDLLVVGTGRRWPGGRTVRACVRHAACPVVVVPPPAMAKGAGGRRTARRLLREATAALEESRPDSP
ncbi:universal stress protein [Actinoplanes sp. NPDC048796]|uniref:universal stress protein n=1 Tax=Actinoplanes sp. NPDC048796 TaxID=3155640 RepID=UPI0034118644